MRTACQGVWNIVRFNRHFYVLASLVLAGALVAAPYLGVPLAWFVLPAAVVAALQIAVSLVVSHLVYDRSGLYMLKPLDEIRLRPGSRVVNLHAGFDETSALIRTRLPDAGLSIWDFHDPGRHTEVSLRRARAAYPPDPGQVTVTTARLPMEDDGADLVCLFLAAHEIRSHPEQEQFFSEVRRILKPDGTAWVTEHLRDLPNILAYSIGALHFFPRSRWLRVFRASGLVVHREEKVTPFISSFLLRKS